MTNYAKIDHDKRAIVMDKTFAKNAAIVGSKEYDLLQQCRNDYNEYDVIVRRIKKNASQDHYKGLTYDYMRWYIKTHSGKNAPDMLRVFEDMVLITKCHSNCKRYPFIKKTFLEWFPEVKLLKVYEMEDNDFDEELADAA